MTWHAQVLLHTCITRNFKSVLVPAVSRLLAYSLKDQQQQGQQK
jgi:hypothetical protein